MKKEKIEELKMEYISPETEKIRKEKVRFILEEIGIDLSELESLEKFYNEFGELPVPEPSEKMDNDFYSSLEKHKNKSSLFGVNFFVPFLEKLKTYSPKIAYAAVILFIGIGIGQWIIPQPGYETEISNLTKEVYAMKEAVMISKLNQPSPTERIKAINSATELNQVDTKIVNALLFTLNNDPNVNVRLVTIDALTKFADKPEVRAGLIKSIINQNSPVVQLELAELMAALQEKDSVNELKKLLEQKELNDVVRSNVENIITKLI